jgi:hypothetical protein
MHFRVECRDCALGVVAGECAGTWRYQEAPLRMAITSLVVTFPPIRSTASTTSLTLDGAGSLSETGAGGPEATPAKWL